MNYVLLLLFTACTFVLGSTRADNGFDTADVCVVGAGPAGIQAAYALEKKGYTVAVIEKNAYVGGKTKTVQTSPDIDPYPMGAVIRFEGGPLQCYAADIEFEKLVKEFGIDTKKYPTVPEVPSEFYTDTTIVDFSDTTPIRFLPELLTWTAKRPSYDKYTAGADAYVLDYPEELNTMSTLEWMKENGMGFIGENLFWRLFTTYGYGHPKDIPALYVLKRIDVFYLLGGNLPLGLSNARQFPYQELLQKMADSLQGTIYLEANITGVSYQDQRTLLYFTLGNAAPTPDPPLTISCGSTIIAFAQTAKAMRNFIPPDSHELANLFGQVQTYNYYTLLIDDTDSAFDNKRIAKYHTPEADVPDNPARNLLFIKANDFPGSSVIAYYFSPSEKTDNEAMAESLSHYSRLIGREVTSEKVQDFNAWLDYFPHVNSSSLQEDFFRKLDSYQGHYQRYYAGGLFNFETVQRAMQHALYIVDTYF